MAKDIAYIGRMLEEHQDILTSGSNTNRRLFSFSLFLFSHPSHTSFILSQRSTFRLSYLQLPSDWAVKQWGSAMVTVRAHTQHPLKCLNDRLSSHSPIASTRTRISSKSTRLLKSPHDQPAFTHAKELYDSREAEGCREEVEA